MIDVRQFLQCFPSSQGLPEASLSHFVNELEVHEFGVQAVVFAAGDIPDALYLLAQGSILVLQSGSAGPAVTLGRIGRGEMVGEMGVLDGSPRSASAVVEEPVIAWRLSRKGYEMLCEEGHPAIDWLLREIGGRLSHRIRSVERRIARVRDQPSLSNVMPAEAVQRHRWYSSFFAWFGKSR